MFRLPFGQSWSPCSPPLTIRLPGRGRKPCASAPPARCPPFKPPISAPCPPGAVPVETNVENLVDRPPSRRLHRPLPFAADALRSAIIHRSGGASTWPSGWRMPMSPQVLPLHQTTVRPRRWRTSSASATADDQPHGPSSTTSCAGLPHGASSEDGVQISSVSAESPSRSVGCRASRAGFD